ncbi:MAG: hypothetical protein E7Z91_03425 [Cyanobacteria bacterium SIG30]|nr:hypothetical protein [Cyanobacteria bacterium SIG30]
MVQGISNVFSPDYTKHINEKCDFHGQEDKTITLKTTKTKSFDEGQPYTVTKMAITEQTGDKQPVTHEYVLSKYTPSEELELITKQLASFYAKNEYPSQNLQNDGYVTRREDYIY